MQRMALDSAGPLRLRLLSRRANHFEISVVHGHQVARYDRTAFTGAISSHRSQPCSRAASHRPADRARMRRIAGQTGRTI